MNRCRTRRSVASDSPCLPVATTRLMPMLVPSPNNTSSRRPQHVLGQVLPRCHRGELGDEVGVELELVQAQAGTTGFVVLHRWVEILERHFPLQLPDPEHTTE
ncbi:hypothetical protein NI25_00130 [Streptomyces sp. CCM_MD2014]|nr:hypothetical protein NI25_00130 [Streptomyces sp. CCM_MD2014]